MKTGLTLALALAALSMPLLAAADTGTAPSARGDAVFAQLDRNHDGRLSAAELTRLPAALRQQRLDAMDTNHDGKIDKAEFEAAAQRRADHRFGRMDRNGDGALTADELAGPHRDGPPHPRHRWHHGKHRPGHDRRDHHHGPKRTDWLFARMDKNNDGYVSAGEWHHAMAQWHHHAHRFTPAPPHD